MTTPKQPKICVVTSGCQMNEYDSKRMIDVLAESQGAQATLQPEDADIVLLNTCSVREKAQEKVFSELGRIRLLKKNRPELLIGVGGCVASQEGEKIIRRAPYVDLVFGPQTLHRLPQLIQKRRETGKAQVDISFPEIEKFDALPPARKDGVTAFVSIMEGCSKYCSFCIVPYTRGEEMSRSLESVLEEITGLAEQGVREITLLGQNVNAYQAPDTSREPVDFALLLAYINEIPGIERIRYTTSHPLDFTQRLIAAHATLPKLAPYVHLPVQSGSDRILSAMKRGYTVLEYKSIIRRLRAANPSIALSSDFIVGFPGETEDDFQKTLLLIDEVQFDDAFSFIYSPRPGTPAASLPDTTPDTVKLERLHKLQKKIDQCIQRHTTQMVGTTQKVLVEKISRKNNDELSGRTAQSRTVNFPGSEALIGKFVDVSIVSVHTHSLRGVISESASGPTS